MRCNFGTGAERGDSIDASAQGPQAGACRFYVVFHVFRGGQPDLPARSGCKGRVNLWPAFLGLAISAVGLPVAGVIAVARADGLDKLAGRVHPVFAQVFMILIYLSIGPCLAIPRTASTSFAMLTPLLGSSAGLLAGILLSCTEK